MTVSEFLQQLERSRLPVAGQVPGRLAKLSVDQRPADGPGLARWLIGQELLTPYQAQQLLAGKGETLVLGNYVITDQLGQGGMGVVLKAEHRRMDRVVALKVLSPAVVNTPEALQRFQREVKAVARLDHPNIVTAHDADEAHGTHFLVMQYVEGTDLGDLVKRKGPLPVSRALNYLSQAARGLEYAHSRGIIHRDIKPSNMLLDRQGTIKILDMGLARLESTDEEQDQLTGTGRIMGTVDFMAPEQAMDTRTADARSDIYSLGITLWYLLTGRPAYAGETLMKKIMAHQHAPIPSLTAACPEATPELENLFTRMVAKDPARRPQSTSEVLAELERCQQPNSATVTVARPSAPRESTAPSAPVVWIGEPGVDSSAAALEPTANMEAASAETLTRDSLPATAAETASWLHPRRLLKSRRGWLVLGGLLLLVPVAGFFFAKPDLVAERKGPEQKSEVSGQQIAAAVPEQPEIEKPFSLVGSNAGELWENNALAMEFRWCPPGTFTMGSPAEEKDRNGDEAQVEVILTSGFWLGQYEVTQREWQQMMGTMPWKGDPEVREGDSYPAPCTTWNGAVEFCEKLTQQEQQAGHIPRDWAFVLPAEPQWEYACRAGTRTRYSYGDDPNYEQLADYGWFHHNTTEAQEAYAHQVGLKKPNPWNLHDMHGNLWEWCQELYTVNPPWNAGHVVKQNSSERTNRGGSWRFLPQYCRSACRGKFRTEGNTQTGFRVALMPLAVAKTVALGPAATRPLAAVQAGELWEVNGLGLKFCWCPPGTFTMGSPLSEQNRLVSEAPVNVTLSRGFWLGQCEVTQGEWEGIMGTTPWRGQDLVQEKGRFPATHVSWEDAMEFCTRLTTKGHAAGWLPQDWKLDLPTEAQWEYACRSGTQTRYGYGDDESQLGQYAWFDKNAYDTSEKYAHQVGQKKPNPWNLYDMHGNVGEWCRDWESDRLPGGTDPEVVTGRWSRIFRSGNWSSSAGHNRSASRNKSVLQARSSYLGFRLALVPVTDAKPAPPQPAEAPVHVGVNAGDLWEDNSLQMKFRWCPPGTFQMGGPGSKPAGDPEEQPVQVTLSQGFWLGQYEVTQAEWEKVLGTTPVKFQTDAREGPGYPVTYIKWAEAGEFCTKLTAQGHTEGWLPQDWKVDLPTEAQWEYACRASTPTRFSFGNDESLLPQYAWFNKNAAEAGERYAHEVGRKPPNPWGLHDMHGNVWEWCRDSYAAKLPGGNDPDVQGTDEARIFRGGGWEDSGSSCASAFRLWFPPEWGLKGVGVRVVLVQVAEAKPVAPQPVEIHAPVGSKAGDLWNHNRWNLNFRWCPPGTFTMGSPETEPGHTPAEAQVTVTFTQGFWLAEFEVTQDQYTAFMLTNFYAMRNRVDRAGLMRRVGAAHAVYYVSWSEAMEYCRKMTAEERAAGRIPANWEYTLPTEAQWEYACRAGTTTATALGDTLDKTRANILNDGEQIGANTHGTISTWDAKDSLGVNAWKIYGMHGNVAEWCRDWYVDELPGGNDPQVQDAASGQRVIRGGSWSEPFSHCRSAYRASRNPDDPVETVGFRVALVPVTPASSAP